jgi:hypothetical protein
MSQLALDSPRIEQEHAQIAEALQREFGQQDQVVPIRGWAVKGDPWLRGHCDASIDGASVRLTGLGGVAPRPL